MHFSCLGTPLVKSVAFLLFFSEVASQKLHQKPKQRRRPAACNMCSHAGTFSNSTPKSIHPLFSVAVFVRRSLALWKGLPSIWCADWHRKVLVQISTCCKGIGQERCWKTCESDYAREKVGQVVVMQSLAPQSALNFGDSSAFQLPGLRT